MWDFCFCLSERAAMNVLYVKNFGWILGHSTWKHSQLLKNTRKKVTKNAQKCEKRGVFSRNCTQNEPQKPEGRGMGSTCSTFCNKKCVLAVFSGQNCRHFWVNFGLQHSKTLVVAQKYSSKSYEKRAKMRKTGYFFKKLYTKWALITRRSWVQIPPPQPNKLPDLSTG